MTLMIFSFKIFFVTFVSDFVFIRFSYNFSNFTFIKRTHLGFLVFSKFVTKKKNIYKIIKTPLFYIKMLIKLLKRSFKLNAATVYEQLFYYIDFTL